MAKVENNQLRIAGAEFIMRLVSAMEATSNVDLVTQFAARGKGGIVSTLNPFLLYLTAHEPAVAKYISHSDIVTCDSVIMGWIGRLLGLSLVTQTGADIVKSLLEQKGCGPIVIIGPEREQIALLKSPNKLIPIECPYSSDLNKLLKRAMAQIDLELTALGLCSSEPLYLVALGPRKQEHIANALIDERGAQRTICCGAAIDYLTGKERRAPYLLRRMGLEWLWRLLQNPSKKVKVSLVYSPIGLIKFLRVARSYSRQKRNVL